MSQGTVKFFNETKGFGFIIPAFEKLKEIHPRKKYVGKLNPKNIEIQNLLTKLKFVLKSTYPDYLLYEYVVDDGGRHLDVGVPLYHAIGLKAREDKGGHILLERHTVLQSE